MNCKASILLLFIICITLPLVGCNVKFGGGGGTSSINVQSHSSCHSATGQPTTCTIQLTNESNSTDPFAWTATSEPAGAQFDPSSGSVNPGATSDTIQVSVPSGICPFTLTFQDSTHNTSIQTNQEQC